MYRHTDTQGNVTQIDRAALFKLIGGESREDQVLVRQLDRKEITAIVVYSGRVTLVDAPADW